MASSAGLLPFPSVAAGDKFSAFVSDKFGMPVAPGEQRSGVFSLLVAFGRCKSRLEESFVARTLGAILGGPAEHFLVSLVEDRIFFFLVSSKAIGFEVYKIRKFICAEFELSFHLFNEAGLSSARTFSSGLPVYPWVEVSKKSSYAEVAAKPAVFPSSTKQISVRRPAVPLSGANKIPVRTPPARQFAAPRVHGKSFFDRLSFPRVSSVLLLSSILFRLIQVLLQISRNRGRLLNGMMLIRVT